MNAYEGTNNREPYASKAQDSHARVDATPSYSQWHGYNDETLDVPEWMPSQFKGRTYGRSRTSDRLAVSEYSLGETVANSISNGIAAALAIASLVILVVIAVMHGAGVRLLSALCCGIPLFLAFLMSTLYHAIPVERARRVFEVLDCSFVYLAIAGVVTPYCLVAIPDIGGILICSIEWAIALAGAIVEAVWYARPRWLPIAISAVMCLVCVPLFVMLYGVLNPVGWWLAFAGALCFAGRLAFALFSHVPYLSFVSHVLALAGFTLVFFSIALFVL